MLEEENSRLLEEYTRLREKNRYEKAAIEHWRDLHPSTTTMRPPWADMNQGDWEEVQKLHERMEAEERELETDASKLEADMTNDMETVPKDDTPATVSERA